MRLGCYDCVRKHLGEAAIFETEIGLGYPNFDIYVIGCLSHASQEAQAINPELAACIREYRMAWDLDHSVYIPYEGLSEYIKVCGAATETPALPEDLRYCKT